MICTIICLTLFLDQFAKFLIAKNLPPGRSITVIKNVFCLTLVANRGAAFGILKNQTPLFIVTSLFALVLVYFNLKKENQKKSYNIGLALIAAGALGNLIDRLTLGYVVDFLDFHIWPVFNVADSAITVGAVLLGYAILKYPDEDKTNPK